MQLTGSTISLVPLELSHVPELLKYSGDPSLWTWWVRRPPIDEASMRSEVEIALANQAAGLRIPFAIQYNLTGEPIGSTSLWHIDREKGTLEIGSTWLGTPFHRTSINRECKDLLIRHSFDELGMSRVRLQTDELNVRSRRAIEKLGATFDGLDRDNIVTWNGRVRSSVWYSISREIWNSRQ